MFSNLHVQREPLSVRQRMSEILSRIRASSFTSFGSLFDPEEGRMGVAVTFIAILELLRESVIEVVQAHEFAPLHVRAASKVRLVGDGAPPGDLTSEHGETGEVNDGSESNSQMNSES
jgi:segregation and condensation protein A